jgi:nitrite reductase/ring-hydroxylating ferredoxin subunit
VCGLEGDPGAEERPAAVTDGSAISLPMAPPAAGAGAPPSGFELPIVHAGGAEGTMAAPPKPADPARWVAVAESVRPGRGATREVNIDGTTVLFADVADSLLAYQSECASCGARLGAGHLEDGMLRCPSCEVEFDLPRAGRAAGGEPLQLRPVPLLADGGLRVAI